MAEDDSPWRPDADVRFEHGPTRSFHDPAPDTTPPDASFLSRFRRRGVPKPRRERGTRGRWGLAAGVAVAGLSAVVLLGGEDAEYRGSMAADVELPQAVGSTLALAPVPCGSDRLPSFVEARWERELVDVDDVVEPVVVRNGLVALLATSERPGSPAGERVQLRGLSGASGTPRWEVDLDPAAAPHEIVAFTSGIIVVRSAGEGDGDARLTGYDFRFGDERWSTAFDGAWSPVAVADLRREVVIVEADAAPDSEIDRDVHVVDVGTGETVVTAPGSIVGVDDAGNVITLAGDKVLRTSSVSPEADTPELVGLVEPSNAAFTVVGSRIVVADPELSAVSVFDERFVSDREIEQRPLIGSADLEPPRTVVRLDQLGADSLLVTGNGAVHGAAVDEFAVDVAWRADGVVLNAAPTDRGALLHMATEGGASQRLVDASNGRTVVALEIRPGSLSTVGLFPNGMVVLERREDGVARVAVDLDGDTMWELPGSGPVAVADGVVVDVVDDPDTGVVTVSGYTGNVGTTGCTP